MFVWVRVPPEVQIKKMKLLTIFFILMFGVMSCTKDLSICYPVYMQKLDKLELMFHSGKITFNNYTKQKQNAQNDYWKCIQ